MKAIRVNLLVGFEGSAYLGWQVQMVGVGIQQLIESAITSVFQLQARLHGSSRTDTGVHARGMVAHFDLPAERLKMKVSKVPLALNAKLPDDIREVVSRAVEKFPFEPPIRDGVPARVKSDMKVTLTAQPVANPGA